MTQKAAAALVLVLVLGVAGGCAADGPDAEAAVPGADVPVEQVAAEHGDAVWRVETDGCGWTGVGSAFAIDATRFVTNHHVIANDSSPVLRSRSGDVRSGRVVGADPERDVAVIEVDDPVESSLPWAPTASLRVDERVVVLGYPRPDHAFTVSYGSIVTIADGPGDEDAVLANAPVERGSSGGPALRGDGSVIGVVTRAVLDDPSHFVTIVHPAGALARAVERATTHPTEVLSDCGRGPDYVPPVPPQIRIAEPPPPPSPEVTAPSSSASSAPPEPLLTSTTWSRPLDPVRPELPATTTAPVCPAGTVEVVISHRSTVETEDGRRIDVQGSVVNRASDQVRVEAVRVTVDDEEPVVVTVVPDPPQVPAGQAAAWEAAVVLPTGGDDEPALRVVATVAWSEHAGPSGCPDPVVVGV